MVNGISNDDLQEIYYSNAAASFLSIIGCLFIIVLYLSSKELQKIAFKLVVFLSFFDLLNSISFLIPTYDSSLSDNICVLQGILMNFSTFTAVLWTSFIAISLYSVIVKAYTKLDTLLKWFLLFDLFTATFLTVIPNIYDSGHSETGYCWLYRGGSQGRDVFRFITFLVPLWSIILFNVAVYVILFRNLRAGIGGEDAKIRKKLAIKVGVYPVIMLVCYLPYTVKGILEVQGNWNRFRYEYSFTLVAGVVRCLVGLANAVVYGCTYKVRKVMREKCRRKEGMISCQVLGKGLRDG